VTESEILAATDTQICKAHDWKPTRALGREIAARGLECDPLIQKCLSIGNQKGTREFNDCYTALRIIQENGNAVQRVNDSAAYRDLMNSGFRMMQPGQPQR
jgi:hypothetical protein